MNYKKAHRRYMKVFIPSMVLYMIGAFLVAYLRKHTEVSVSVLIAMAFIPGAAMLSWIWGHWRFINDLDEFLQKLQLQAVMIGLGGVLSIATVWGILEQFVQAPFISTLPIFYVVPMFYVLYGISVLVVNMRNDVKGACL